jgi:small subunit ribosomal protein S9
MADEVKTVVEKKRKSRKKKQIVSRGKRKEAVARAYIKAGKGVIRVNGLLLNAFDNPYTKQIIAEPLSFLQEPFDFDISVTTQGGGVMGQAQAARTAIARALIEFRKDGEELKKQFLAFDRSLFIEDARRVEPKKFKGPKARARFQKSYR